MNEPPSGSGGPTSPSRRTRAGENSGPGPPSSERTAPQSQRPSKYRSRCVRPHARGAGTEQFQTDAAITALAAPRDSQHIYTLESSGKLACLDEQLGTVASLGLATPYASICLLLPSVLTCPRSTGATAHWRLDLSPSDASTLLPSAHRSPGSLVAFITRLDSAVQAKAGGKKKRKSETTPFATHATASIDIVLSAHDVDGPRLTALAHLELPDQDALDIAADPSGFTTVLSTS
jgi:hypothetical protein